MFDGASLNMPMYAPDIEERSAQATALIDALRRADGIVICSPGYHGTVSGLIKNALDYVQDMAKDGRVYFEGRAVGRSEEHTSELQSLMRISYAVFCLKKKQNTISHVHY